VLSRASDQTAGLLPMAGGDPPIES